MGHGPLGDEVFRGALAVGAADVVELPAAEAWLVELLTDAADAAGAPAGRHARSAWWPVRAGPVPRRSRARSR